MCTRVRLSTRCKDIHKYYSLKINRHSRKSKRPDVTATQNKMGQLRQLGRGLSILKGQRGPGTCHFTALSLHKN